MKIVVILLVLSVLSLSTAQFATLDALLSTVMTTPNLFDGPRSVSSAKLPTPPLAKLASAEDIDYYAHYYVVNCPQYVLDLECTDCKLIKSDIRSLKTIDSISGQRVLVAESEIRREIVVSFRGSLTPMDALLDLTFINATPDPDSDIKVHLGFLIAALSLYEEVTEAVACQLNRNPTYKLVLTGLSLGGAIARIFGFYYNYLRQFNGVPITLITFGEPRSGNIHYANYMNSLNITTARVVNQGDLVPHVSPTSILNLNALQSPLVNAILPDYYVHTLYEVWIKSPGNTVYCDYSTYEARNCSNSLGPGYSILYHVQYPETSATECITDAINPSSVANLLSVIEGLPELPKYLQMAPTLECGFVTHLGVIDAV